MIAITVVIPVGGRHQSLVPIAVASCIWQSVASWEAIVINDGVDDIAEFADSRVVIIDSPNRGRTKETAIGNRAAVARNAGIARARGEFIVFLDADDYLLPTAFETLLRGHISHHAMYTYSSHYSGQKHLRPPEYSQEKYATFNLHPITSLIPTSAVQDVGGFDETAPGWEDWTLYLRLAIAGYCGQYYRGPVFVYEDKHSINHIIDVAGGQELMNRVTAPYKDRNGVIHMSKCCGGSNRNVAQQTVNELGPVPVQADGTQILEYIGPMQGASMVKHPESRRVYKFGNNKSVKFMTVPNEDVDYFLNMRTFRVVSNSAPWSPPPSPAVQIVEQQAAPVIAQQAAQIIEQNQSNAPAKPFNIAEFESMINAEIERNANLVIDAAVDESSDSDDVADVESPARRGRKKRDA
jgi:glycosyltransferase involved in cell wall biosynthesis